MEDFKIIYKILNYVQKARDYEEPDYKLIEYEALNISRNKWANIITMLRDEGLLTNIHITQSLDGQTVPYVTTPMYPQITLKGIEYLKENNLMQKAKNTAKGVFEVASKSA